MTPRSMLKDYFKKGKIPRESDFAELIDSMLIQDEDGIRKPANNPLRITATDADETLLNFYRQQGSDMPAWQLRQKAGDRLGLSIHDGNDIAISRLFIESDTGNVGIGTVEPKSLLSVSGGLAVGASYAKANAVAANGLIVEGKVGIGTPTPGARLHVNGRFKVEIPRMVFDGVRGYVGLPSMNPDYSKGFTVEAWVCYHSFKSFSRIIDFGNGPRSDNIVLANVATSADLTFTCISGSSREVGVNASGALDLNTWMHLAATVDQKGNVILYKNGQRLTDGVTSKPNNLPRANNYIGKSNWADAQYFDGQISDVRIWNTARTAQQIHDNMFAELSGTEPDLVACWLLDSADLARDIGPNKFNGTIFSGVEFGQGDQKAGMGFDYNTIYTTGPNQDENINVVPKGNGKVGIMGELIRQVAVATGSGRENAVAGKIPGRKLSFTKQYADTAIRILYCDTIGLVGSGVVDLFWQIFIGDSEPSGSKCHVNIFTDITNVTGEYRMPAMILGYATGISAGACTIQVYAQATTSTVVTPFAFGPWTIEAQEVWMPRV